MWYNRDYLLLWSGQTISQVGVQISQLAFPLLILTLTHSPMQAGIAVALRALPYIIFSLPGGALVDRWDRKRIMIWCDVGRAFSMASILFALSAGHVTIVLLYLVSLIEGTLFVFFDLAETASLPCIVPKERLLNATAQNEITFSLTLVFGPVLGSILFAIGSHVPFLVDTLSYIVSFSSLLLIRTRFQQNRSITARALYKEIIDGLLWLFHKPLLRAMALLGGGYNFILAGQALVVIVLVQQKYASPVIVGTIFTIGGVGGILGSLLSPGIKKRFSFGQVIIGSCWLYTLLWSLYTAGPILLFLSLATAGIFMLNPIYDVVQYTYRLTVTPDELQGRVNSIFRLLIYSFLSLGQAVTGLLLQRYGSLSTILIFLLCSILLSLAASLNTHIRNAHRYI